MLAYSMGRATFAGMGGWRIGRLHRAPAGRGSGAQERDQERPVPGADNLSLMDGMTSRRR